MKVKGETPQKPRKHKRCQSLRQNCSSNLAAKIIADVLDFIVGALKTSCLLGMIASAGLLIVSVLAPYLLAISNATVCSLLALVACVFLWLLLSFIPHIRL